MMAQDSGRHQHPIEIPNESSQAPSVRISNKWSDRFGIQVARVAGCMKRGLGLGRPTLTIMNAAAHSTVPSPSPSGGLEGGASLAQLGLLLQRAALGLFGDFVTTGPDGVSLVDYDAMRSSETFAAYVSLTDKLRCIQMESPAAIGNKDEQLAFWLNLYNCLVIHAKLLRSSISVSGGFFDSIAYIVGGHAFSLDDIEHGILRCNKKHPTSGAVSFSISDPRLPFALHLPLDPRIHFALNCGAKGCPAIRAYNSSNLERGLVMAAHSFCGQHVRVQAPNGWVHGQNGQLSMAGNVAKLLLSKIFLWYESDFSETVTPFGTGLIPFLITNTENETKLQLQALHDNCHLSLRYEEYDWGLNVSRR